MDGIWFGVVVGGQLVLFSLASWAGSWLSHWYLGFITGSSALLTCGKDVFFIWWARRRLFSELPRRATLTALVR